MSGRTIAIGDIHGCSIALRTLIQAIQPRPDDVIVTLGDYIDRGLDSRGVLDQLIELGRHCRLVPLLGNHEEMFLGAMDSRSGLAFWMEFGGQTMLDSYAETGGWEIIPRDHLAFLRSGRNYHETDTHIFVHANYRPNRPLAEQQTATLRWEHLEPARAARHYSGKTVVVGHTPQKSGEILDLGFVVCIDTYCHGGGWLTALDVTSGATWQANERGQLRFTQRLPHGNATSTPNSEGDSTSAPRPAPSAGPPPGEVA